MIQPIIRKSGVVLLRLLVALILAYTMLGVGRAAADTTWTQTTQADFESGTLVQLDSSSSPGDVKLARVGSGYIYAFRGNITKTFWRYDIAADTWSGLADAPQYVGAGGALAYDGGNYIYALGGNGNNYFWRYDIAANTWASLTPTPRSINAGGALTYDGGNYIYALRGNNRTTFWRYSISGNSWSYLSSAPSAVNGGGSLAYGGGDFIYALKGMSTDFWKYQISSNSWSSLTGTPSTVGDGGSLAWNGGSYLYALKGSNTVTFWRYSITGNTWASMADTPATPCVYGGGALVYDFNAHFFALRGNDKTDFWKYDVAGNAWSIKTSTPATVAYGGAMTFRGAPYYTSGNLTSSAYDTGFAADFNTVSWTATTPVGATVKFQVATNNDNATWVFKGPDGTTGTYYTSSGTGIWSGHDGDRHIKYKVFLSTTNINVTPVLHDVSISFTQQIGMPSATTSDATLVEETTATLNGVVANDGGEACQYRFQYGTAPGVYTQETGWTGSKTTGQIFYVDVTGLAKGTKYYFIAQVKNSAGIGSGTEFDFLTKPDPPIDTTFTAAAISDTEINLTWTKGEGALNTAIYRKTGGYPMDRNDGAQVYFDTGTSFTDTGLTPETMYYYRAWSQVTGSEQWSDGYRDTMAQTNPGPTIPPLPPVAVGGAVYPVNKAEVLAPCLAVISIFMLLTGGVVLKLVRKRKRL